MPDRKREMDKTKELPDLYTGMRVEVLTPANRLIFIGRVELLKASLLQVTEENGQNVPWVEYNTKVKLRGFQQGGAPFSLYGYICGSSEKFWRIDRLETLQKEELRRFYRQIVSIPGTVMCVNQIFSQNDGQKNKVPGVVPCTILDLSGGGVRLRCNKPTQFEVGDWLFLSADDPLNGENCMNYTCCVRRVVAGKESCEYGCEFDGLTETEQERLLQIVMTIQQRELRARRRKDTY